MKLRTFSNSSAMETNDILAGYISRTEPVQWVHWLDKVADADSREKLRTVLFDKNDKLRDLTKSKVRGKVLECVRKNPSLRKVVLSEAKLVIERVGARAGGARRR